MIVIILIFALLSDCLLAALVGLLGARRRIGFGWTFLLSALFTPIVGLVAVLLSGELPAGERRWGCLGVLIAICTLVALAVVFALLFLPILSL